TINVEGTDKAHSYDMPFSAVHVIVPKERTEEALIAARDAGARGVTIMEAHGMGLSEMDNFYNRLHASATDSNLMFITKTKNVDNIIKSVLTKLDITGEGQGLTFAYPVSHIKGLRLKIDDI
ncbi:MAG TPA: permease, partial [Sulfurimonas autotrophica]|nr:permease [Sulfurimonas autotrophica]